MREKTIAILTYHRAENFGSALQAYATQEYLLLCGYDVKIIDYHSIGQDKMYALFHKIRSVKDLCKFIYTFRFTSKLSQRKKNFKEYQKKYYKLTEEYTEISQLKELQDRFDYFIAGSDQIWNSLCPDFTEAYFLPFVDNKEKCISYASSINKYNFDSDSQMNFKRYLSKFKALSVRESYSAVTLSKLLNRDVAHVPDPVFLVGKKFWEEFIKDIPRPKEKYIFCYFLNQKKEIRDIANKISNEKKLPLVLVLAGVGDIFSKRCYKAYESGPKEFLRLLYDAEIVIADSFHAMAFSIIFGKKILNYNCTDARRLSALQTIYPTVKFETDTIINFADYSDVCELDNYLQEGKTFLTNNLKD